MIGYSDINSIRAQFAYMRELQNWTRELELLISQAEPSTGRLMTPRPQVILPKASQVLNHVFPKSANPIGRDAFADEMRPDFDFSPY